MINKTLLSACLLFTTLSGYAKNSKTVNGSNQQFTQSAPLAFLENKGQLTDQHLQPRPDIDFKVAASGGLNIFVGDGAIHYQYMRCDNCSEIEMSSAESNNLIEKPQHREIYTAYRMDVELLGANKNATVVADEKLDYYENYFTTGTGENGAKVNAWQRITYKDIYPGIDWILYSKDGNLKHEFIVKKGGRVSDIQLRYGGASSLQLNNKGELTANTPLGSITEQAPYSYQADGSEVASAFHLDGNTVRYTIGNYEGRLTIDPTLSWATFYGGDAYDQAASVTTDASGNVYMVGNTSSMSGIATTGSYQYSFGGGLTYYYGDAMLVKFNSAGVRQWATYYGGTGDEIGYSVTTDAAGNIYLAGITNSTSGIATPGAHQPAFGSTTTSFNDGLLAKFNSAGVRQWATYYGGTENETIYSVVTDDSGHVYVSGSTESTMGISTPGSHQPVKSGGYTDGFIVKFNSAGTRIWGTYYGGPDDDDVWELAMHGNDLYVTGSTNSTTGIATIGAHQTSFAGGTYDAYLAKFNTAGSRIWATYYGGNNEDMGLGLAADDNGNIFLAGHSSSTSAIATAGAYQTSFAGGISDCFLIKFDSTGTRLWGTYYGGPDQDELHRLTTNCTGNLYAAGFTRSTTGISTAGSFQPAYGGGAYDGILAEFSPSGMRTWGTYYGGTGVDIASAAHCDNNGNLYYVGRLGTPSAIVTPGAHQTVYGGGYYDAFVAKFILGALPVEPITGTLALCSGTSVTLATATSGGSWSSGSLSVATIGSSTGVLNGIAAGTAIITCEVSGGCKAFATVTVNTAPSAGTITGTPIVCVSETITLSHTTTGGSWSSSNTAIATVSAVGLVTGIATGSATISYTVTNSCGTASATQSITVTPASACETSVDAITEDELALFPNPSDGTFILAVPATVHITSISATDLLGRVVPVHTSGASTGNIKIVIDNVAAGNYLLKAKADYKTYQKMITIL
jgi:hypothetical protein